MTATQVAEPTTVEVPEVVGAADTGLARVEQTPMASAIERAAEAAIAFPGIPGRDEFLALAAQARMISLSGAAPPAVRDNPHVAFHIAMVGRDLGISPSAAVELIDVIETSKGPRLSLSPQLLNGQIRRLGLGKIVPVVQTVDRCVARAVGPDGETLGETEFDWEEARIAGLVGPDCLPGAHEKNVTRRGNGGEYKVCGCNQGYITYPKRMLWWRASGFCCDDYFPEAGLGLYTAEELGAIVDTEGRAIDASNVELPPGFEPAKKPPKPSEIIDADATWELQERIAALPEQQRNELRERWTASPLKKRPPRFVANDQIQFAKSIVAGFERMAKKGKEWDPALALEVVRAQCFAGLWWFLTGDIFTGEIDPPPVDTPDPEPVGAAESAQDAAQPGEGTTTADEPSAEPTAPQSALYDEAGEPITANIIAFVQGLSPEDVDAELRKRTIRLAGNEDTRRRKLAESLVNEKPF